jgi:ABC-type Fe3+ transport system permease subunit
MNDQRDPLRPLDYIALVVLAIYGLAVAVGIVWMLIQLARLIHATGHGDAICGAVIILLMAAIVVAAPRR